MWTEIRDEDILFVKVCKGNGFWVVELWEKGDGYNVPIWSDRTKVCRIDRVSRPVRANDLRSESSLNNYTQCLSFNIFNFNSTDSSKLILCISAKTQSCRNTSANSHLRFSSSYGFHLNLGELMSWASSQTSSISCVKLNCGVLSIQYFASILFTIFAQYSWNSVVFMICKIWSKM